MNVGQLIDILKLIDPTHDVLIVDTEGADALAPLHHVEPWKHFQTNVSLDAIILVGEDRT